MNTTLESTSTSLATSTAAAPSAPRFDLYGSIHKALRSCMGETLASVGRLDVEDNADMQRALARLDTLLGLCTSHIQHENDFVHSAIEARRPAAAARTAGDHLDHLQSIDALHAEADALRDAAAPARPALAQRLYAHLALFVAENFQHMHIEETANNAALWALYSDAELVALHHRLLASIGPEENMLVARWMIPAVNPAERAAILREVKGQMPPEPFLGLLSMLRPHLDDSGWDKLTRAVGVSPAFAPATRRGAA